MPEKLITDKETGLETSFAMSLAPAAPSTRVDKVIEYVRNDLKKDVDITWWHMITIGMVMGMIYGLAMKPCNRKSPESHPAKDLLKGFCY